MRLGVLAIGAVASICLGEPAAAQPVTSTTFYSGNLLIRLRVDAVMPNDFTSSVALAGSNALAGSRVHVSNYVMPEIDISYFLAPHWSIEALFGTSRHNATATTPLGKVKVGSTWVLPPFVMLDYHFPAFYNFIPYVGAGISANIFYNSHHAEGGLVNSVHFNNSIGPALEIGIDYNISERFYANVFVIQSFAGETTHINHGEIIAKTKLDVTGPGFGIGYRF